MLAHLEGQWWKQQDPDPLIRGMDPRIQIHTKMSWIRNTENKYEKVWNTCGGADHRRYRDRRDASCASQYDHDRGKRDRATFGSSSCT